MRILKKFWGNRKYDPICSFPSCDEDHKSKGYCVGHLKQLRSGKPLTALKSKSDASRKYDEICSFPGCEEDHRAHGYCVGHLDQLRRHGAATKPLRKYTKRSLKIREKQSVFHEEIKIYLKKGGVVKKLEPQVASNLLSEDGISETANLTNNW